MVGWPESSSARRHRLLYVGASPTGQDIISTDREWREIRRAWRSSLNKQDIDIEYASAATWTDFCEEVGQMMPDAVHVAAHANEDGIYFEHENHHDGDPRTPEQVVETLKGVAYRPSILLFMNCHSDDLEEACKAIFPATVTSRGKLNDADSLAFVRSFYRSLFTGNTVGWSFNNAHTAGSDLQLHANESTQVFFIEPQGPLNTPGDREHPSAQILRPSLTPRQAE